MGLVGVFFWEFLDWGATILDFFWARGGRREHIGWGRGKTVFGLMETWRESENCGLKCKEFFLDGKFEKGERGGFFLGKRTICGDQLC